MHSRLTACFSVPFFLPQAGKLARACVAVLLSHHAAGLAQTPVLGPDFARGGFKIAQLNESHPSFDRYVVQRNFAYGYDQPQREGLIDVRLTVDADGRVSAVEMLGGFYDDKFLQEALNGIKGSFFRHASAGETAVEWTQLDIRIIQRGFFAAEADAVLNREFAELFAMMRDKRYAEAEAFALQLLTDKAELLFEYAHLQDQLALIYMATDRLHEALIASRNATAGTKAITPPSEGRAIFSNPGGDDYPDEFLPQSQYVPALQRRVLLALATNQSGEALRSWEMLKAKLRLSNDTSALDALEPKIGTLQQALASEQTLAVPIRLVQGVWSFTLSDRRTIGATGLQGKIDFIDVNCEDATKRRLPFVNDNEWHVPESWGRCSLEFRGDDDSAFTLIEFPD
jgi:hypothetical protein